MMRLFIVLLFTLSLSSCWMARGYKVRNFNLTDHERIPFVTIQKSENPQPFPIAKDTSAYIDIRNYLDTTLPFTYTAAFLVIKNDSIIYERYFNGFNQSSLLPSFSVAKSYVGTLVGVAIDEGKITSTAEPITNYLPELLKRDKRFEDITIQHLLDMRSGIKFNEGTYNAKDDAIRLGFRPNLLKYALKLEIEKAPGTYKYQSINTELLALIVERTTGKKISSYLQEKLWQPLGAEYNATWNVDSRKRKQEIAFAGLNATARDFAKLGRLYLQKGKWNGQTLLNPRWVSAVNNVDSMRVSNFYRNQWWSRPEYKYFKDSLSAVSFIKQSGSAGGVQNTRNGYRVNYRNGAFSAHGILNQYIYINPVNNVIIVRLGRYWSHPTMYPVQFIYHMGGRF